MRGVYGALRSAAAKLGGRWRAAGREEGHWALQKQSTGEQDGKITEREPQAKEDLLEAYVAESSMNSSEALHRRLMRVREEFQLHSTDSGSSPVQIARLTYRIAHLNAHLQKHYKDKHSKRGLLQLVSQRRKLLRYMRRKDLSGYAHLIDSLGIKDRSLHASPSARYKEQPATFR
jgi:ribosomal protein S15